MAATMAAAKAVGGQRFDDTIFSLHGAMQILEAAPLGVLPPPDDKLSTRSPGVALEELRIFRMSQKQTSATRSAAEFNTTVSQFANGEVGIAEVKRSFAKAFAEVGGVVLTASKDGIITQHTRDSSVAVLAQLRTQLMDEATLGLDQMSRDVVKARAIDSSFGDAELASIERVTNKNKDAFAWLSPEVKQEMVAKMSNASGTMEWLLQLVDQMRPAADRMANAERPH